MQKKQRHVYDEQVNPLVLIKDCFYFFLEAYRVQKGKQAAFWYKRWLIELMDIPDIDCAKKEAFDTVFGVDVRMTLQDKARRRRMAVYLSQNALASMEVL